MSKITTIVFDLDGTLLDTLDDLTDSVNEIMKCYGMPMRTKEEIRKFVGNGAVNLLKQAVPEGEQHPKFQEILQAFKTYYGAHCNEKTCAYEGILPLLEVLQEKGYEMAIVSNKPDAAVKELNQRYFEKYIHVAMGDREGIRRKPNPDTVFEALASLGKDKEEAIYIGDSEVDIETAKNAQMRCISVLWGFRDRDCLENNGAQIFARIPEDILRFL